MKTIQLLVPLLILLLGAQHVDRATAGLDPPARPHPELSVSAATGVLEHGGPASALAKAETDTFWLYGGPGTEEGKFQTGPGGLQPDSGGWIGVDLTDQPVYWQRSTFNAANLNGNGGGNIAAWSGLSDMDGQWATPPGYGNNWFDSLIFELQVSDPSQGQTVGLDFYFNHDLEPGYDFFEVYYDSAGRWIQTFAVDGTNADASSVFVAPGVQYSTVGAPAIVYAGNDYAGPGADRVRVRLVVSSDGGWSDEDGIFPTVAGAAQVDDITVTTTSGVSFTDFESDFGDWRPDKTQFVGDFAAFYPQFDDLDPCRSNRTPVAAFIDHGQELCAENCLPGSPTSTGGTTSANWSYGFPGGWVVNYNGGLSFGESSLANEIWSPEIAWDLPGTADDDPAAVGLILSFDVWEHLPLFNGIFHVWQIRSSSDASGAAWSDWQSRNFVYYSARAPRWITFAKDVSDLVVSGAQRVQISLGAHDLAALFGFRGADATPSPVYDNVGLRRFRFAGPTLVTRTIDLANDGFPVSGSIDASIPAARDLLDIPFDMARDVSTGTANLPGDSITVDVEAIIPGTTIADLRMVWVLDRNPLFEDEIRAAPSRVKDQNVDTSDPSRWFGDVLADSSKTSAGAWARDRFFFDLPDVDFLYPGDRLRYYIQATDSDGRVSTLPADITGFDTGLGWNRTYQVYGLPSILDAAGTQPPRLVINDFGRRGGENDFLSAMSQIGLQEGIEYDTYTVQAPTSLVSNGIGSAGAHGANADQLAGYHTIIYFAGDLSAGLLSGGEQHGWGGNDKGDDLGVLTSWHDQAGDRRAIFFGDNIASAIINDSPPGALFVQTVLGVSLNDADVRDEIDDQTAPVVLPVAPGFLGSFVAYGGCLGINRFDSIAPLPGAVRGHGFEMPGTGQVYPGLAASVIHDRVDGLGDRKIDVTFPFGFITVRNRNDVVSSSPLSARSILLEEVLSAVGSYFPPYQITGAPDQRRAKLAVFPSPFNPRTTVSLAAPWAGAVRVEVFDLRGRRVRTLFAGEVEAAGEMSWVWEGRDEAGASVASGVYVIRAAGIGFDEKTKVALVR